MYVVVKKTPYFKHVKPFLHKMCNSSANKSNEVDQENNANFELEVKDELPDRTIHENNYSDTYTYTAPSN